MYILRVLRNFFLYNFFLVAVVLLMHLATAAAVSMPLYTAQCEHQFNLATFWRKNIVKKVLDVWIVVLAAQRKFCSANVILNWIINEQSSKGTKTLYY